MKKNENIVLKRYAVRHACAVFFMRDSVFYKDGGGQLYRLWIIRDPKRKKESFEQSLHKLICLGHYAPSEIGGCVTRNDDVTLIIKTKDQKSYELLKDHEYNKHLFDDLNDDSLTNKLLATYASDQEKGFIDEAKADIKNKRNDKFLKIDELQ
jgi:hypothetical protein